jgi:hypothetical protein
MVTTPPGMARLLSDPGDLDDLPEEVGAIDNALPSRVNVDPESVEKGLTKLVLVLVELVRRLMEHQAMRRVEGGSLTEEEIERLGDTFVKLNNRMQELKLAFGLENEELNLNLGPLGDLM